MATLAVDQHQRAVRRQATQVGRAYQGRGVADRLQVDVDRGHHGADLVEDVGQALVVEFLAAEWYHGTRIPRCDVF